MASPSGSRNINALADTLGELATRGEVHVDDPWLAAQQFTWTAVGAPLNAHTIGGRGARTPPDELARLALAAAGALTVAPTTADPG